MANNTGITPGTRMRHVGITDTSEQDFILEYLRSISN
jgi:cytochrome c